MAAASRGAGVRRAVKHVLAAGHRSRPAAGTTILIYHRIGGGTPDERDVTATDFEAQVAVLDGHRVVGLDTALDELEAGDDSPKLVLTFDDGFADVYETAWPLLRDADLPFTIYLATAYIGGTMDWEGSTATASGPALSWTQLEELAASPLVTIGNHTHTHARPEALTAGELDRCTQEVEQRLAITPRHFCFTWGVAVPEARPLLAERFRSAVTGEVGRNHPGDDVLALRRIPVRATDPLSFFRARLGGGLWPQYAYEALVRGAKRLGVSG